MTPPIYIDFLNRFDVEALKISNDEILEAIQSSLLMQGKGETSIEPRMHIQPRAGVEGHFNVLRGWIGGAIDSAGTKVVGDFVDNFKEDRPSEYGVLTLFDPKNGAPFFGSNKVCLLYTSPSPRDATLSRMPSSA